MTHHPSATEIDLLIAMKSACSTQKRSTYVGRKRTSTPLLAFVQIKPPILVPVIII